MTNSRKRRENRISSYRPIQLRQPLSYPTDDVLRYQNMSSRLQHVQQPVYPAVPPDHAPGRGYVTTNIIVHRERQLGHSLLHWGLIARSVTNEEQTMSFLTIIWCPQEMSDAFPIQPICGDIIAFINSNIPPVIRSANEDYPRYFGYALTLTVLMYNPIRFFNEHKEHIETFYIWLDSGRLNNIIVCDIYPLNETPEMINEISMSFRTGYGFDIFPIYGHDGIFIISYVHHSTRTEPSIYPGDILLYYGEIDMRCFTSRRMLPPDFFSSMSTRLLRTIRIFPLSELRRGRPMAEFLMDIGLMQFQIVQPVNAPVPQQSFFMAPQHHSSSNSSPSDYY